MLSACHTSSMRRPASVTAARISARSPVTVSAGRGWWRWLSSSRQWVSPSRSRVSSLRSPGVRRRCRYPNWTSSGSPRRPARCSRSRSRIRSRTSPVTDPEMRTVSCSLSGVYPPFRARAGAGGRASRARRGSVRRTRRPNRPRGRSASEVPVAYSVRVNSSSGGLVSVRPVGFSRQVYSLSTGPAESLVDRLWCPCQPLFGPRATAVQSNRQVSLEACRVSGMQCPGRCRAMSLHDSNPQLSGAVHESFHGAVFPCAMGAVCPCHQVRGTRGSRLRGRDWVCRRHVVPGRASCQSSPRPGNRGVDRWPCSWV